MKNRINVGIWLAKRNALLVTITGGIESMNTIESEIEEFRPKGGSGTRSKGGPQDVVQDSKYTERQKQQEKRYFKEIAQSIPTADEIVIFGPAEMGKKLNAELEVSFPKIHAQVTEVKPADSMTDNQVRAWVREYFE